MRFRAETLGVSVAHYAGLSYGGRRVKQNHHGGTTATEEQNRVVSVVDFSLYGLV
jgi:hypothetical protein